MERTSDYWFMIEPYVHINIAMAICYCITH